MCERYKVEGAEILRSDLRLGVFFLKLRKLNPISLVSRSPCDALGMESMKLVLPSTVVHSSLWVVFKRSACLHFT